MENKKLSILEQVEHMESKGIKFNIIDTESAKRFLTYNSYYFKLKSYAKNYEKDSEGRYINLEFVYLKELSTIDMHLRRFIIRMTLDIEHSLKTKLLRDCVNNHREDGYNIVKSFLNTYPNLKEGINNKKSKTYNSDLINKFQHNYALWNIVEVLTFGEFILLYKFYYKEYPSSHSYTNLLFPVKSIRNASAHSNCIINTLRTPYSMEFERNKKLENFLGKIDTIGVSSKSKLDNLVIHDFVAMLYLFYLSSSSKGLKLHAYEDLKRLLIERVAENKDFFASNPHIKTSYEFILKIVDFLSQQSI